MDVAFITTVNLDDLSDLAGTAEEISDALMQAGFEVKSTHAWARPALQQQGVSPIAVPTTPTIQQTTIET